MLIEAYLNIVLKDIEIPAKCIVNIETKEIIKIKAEYVPLFERANYLFLAFPDEIQRYEVIHTNEKTFETKDCYWINKNKITY